MEWIWRLLFALLTALQFTTSVASPVYLAQQTPPHAALTKSVTVPGPQPTPDAPNAIYRDARSTSTPLPRPKRNWNDPPSLEVLTSPAKVITSVGPSGTAQVLASKKTPATGFIPSILDTVGHVTSVPLLTKPIPKPTSLLAAVSVVVSLKISPSISVKMTARDIFVDPISTDAPPGNIGREQDHPVPRLGIQGKGPFETNKFYGNFHRGNQTSPTYLHPYSVAWVRGQGASGSWGLAVSHVEAHQRVYGQASPVTGAVSYFINPIGIHSVCLSAKELGSDTVLTSEGLTDFSIQVALRPAPQAAPAVQFPLVQGVGFITAIYDGASPVLQTSVFFRTVTRMTADPKPGVTKYKLQLEDGATWLVYARHTQGDPLDLEVVNNGLAQAKGPFYGTIQLAKDPGDGEKVYDQACGAYPVGVQLSGSVDGAKGTYRFSFKKPGTSDTALAIWTMGESNLPTNIGFLPWSPQAGSVSAISNATRQVIHNIAQQEVSQNIIQQLDENSMYFSGKAYVNMLVRDIANPSTQDQYFPLWRCFDWFHGHSWAHGLSDTLDGNDQESSSEDTMHAYALKMWGSITGDKNLEARSPASCSRTRSTTRTYFGNRTEDIQGIHMLPLLPHTPLIRTPAFVREEWDTYFSGGREGAITGGWKGVVWGNYATVDPRGAYAFFAGEGFDPAWLDGGASLTWYLCYSAALGGL
ncbi:hypothetical protein CHGG_09117 [Chaetomium globosum CBS 148.51]|uniref:glucan endo-1,3-beta-D-glucosidase n=1 Tax=Chaetomium globosum (strain ATCC 6205 / CBS 148.51 / DSM 1962 / NBRC 6347 / NRRL 1970) TaxID=306901 RepID=Q2GSD7_CHAGB|nr:uncharacterized protein CHGG_09117 [Chaetomium globosum CBS 148.51]EAQ85103.1 hypothetical protein CHGG_09117 [Chaetomium globosum CBS 148.51]